MGCRCRLVVHPGNANSATTLRTACNHITATINNFTSKGLKDLSGSKRWKCLAPEGDILIHQERAEVVAYFRLTSGHDYLQAHLQASDGIWPLCRIANMDGDPLRNCIKFIDVPDDITERYWEARRRMAEQPQTGVG
ncbi:reverse transcriptase [Caerostris darwini]|uniref:Reverse transcriptase n=1 Tax=Caerostris darwini TaxID=1538125 RepID=A0AAV4RHA0_9ARAC|nr:reverse transcriptase [Caerostris darwini]